LGQGNVALVMALGREDFRCGVRRLGVGR